MTVLESTLKLIGFRKYQSMSLAVAEATDLHLPIVCWSDSHIAASADFADDRVQLICQLLDRLPNTSIAILGDIFEALPVARPDARRFLASARIAPFLSRIARRGDVWVVPGNHDASVVHVLRELLPGRVYPGGFELDGIRFVHGHELATSQQPLPATLWRSVIPIGVILTRMGVPVGTWTTSSNQLIARYVRGSSRFVVFGHTHFAEITEDYANTGSMVKSAPATVVVIDGESISTWSTER